MLIIEINPRGTAVTRKTFCEENTRREINGIPRHCKIYIRCEIHGGSLFGAVRQSNPL